MLELINKQKIKADNYLTGFLVITYLGFAVFFRLEWIMSVIIYPFVALFFHGILKIMNGANKRNRGNDKNINRILFGIISILFSIAMLNFIISQPNVNFQHIINLASYPMVVVGIAGIVKGFIINVYSLKFRQINILVGIITLGVSAIAFYSHLIIPIDIKLIHLISLSLMLFVNILSRAALYLSEYNLSVLNFRNFKLFFYIISDYLLYLDGEGNVFLSKIE